MKHIRTLAKTLFYSSIFFILSATAQAEVLWAPDISQGLANVGFTVPTQTPPNRITVVTDEDSQTYFGAPDVSYIRFRKMSGSNFSLSASDVIAVSKASPLTVASFNFVMKNEGSGTMALTMFTSGHSSANRVMEMRLIHPEGSANGNINGSASATYALGTAMDIKIYHNNSSNAVDYLVGSSIFSLESGRYTVFLNNEAVLINTNVGTGHGGSGNGDGISSILFNYYGTNTGEILINDLSLSSFSAIPESSTISIALGSLALAAVALGRRYLRRK